jgi:hypothetical protein
MISRWSTEIVESTDARAGVIANLLLDHRHAGTAQAERL